MERENQEKAKKFSNRRGLVISAGTGVMLGNAAFGIWDQVNAGLDCGPAIITTGLIALCVTGAALLKENPYTGKNIETTEEKEQEVEVKEEEPKVKKLERK